MISHYQVALYTARRDEMVETVQKTLFYMNPEHPIPVHSTYATLPYEVRIFFSNLFCLIFLRLCAYIRLCRGFYEGRVIMHVSTLMLLFHLCFDP